MYFPGDNREMVESANKYIHVISLSTNNSYQAIVTESVTICLLDALHEPVFALQKDGITFAYVRCQCKPEHICLLCAYDVCIHLQLWCIWLVDIHLSSKARCTA